MTVEDFAITVTPVVSIGYNIATITVTDNKPIWYGLNWGTATGVYTNSLPITEPTRVWNADGTYSWVTKWVLTNVQQPANQAYFAVTFVPGSISPEITWTQPGLNASGSDLIRIDNRVVMQLGRISDICQKANRQGWLSSSDYNGLRRAAALISVYNVAKFNDGR